MAIAYSVVDYAVCRRVLGQSVVISCRGLLVLPVAAFVVAWLQSDVVRVDPRGFTPPTGAFASASGSTSGRIEFDKLTRVWTLTKSKKSRTAQRRNRRSFWGPKQYVLRFDTRSLPSKPWSPEARALDSTPSVEMHLRGDVRRRAAAQILEMAAQRGVQVVGPKREPEGGFKEWLANG